MKLCQLNVGLLLFLLAFRLSATGQAKPLDVAGTWQISWEARIGIERDTVKLGQTGTQLNGTFYGKLGMPKVSGKVEGAHITLRMDFPGPRPYTLLFAGTTDGNKMSGNLEVPGVDGAYDFHGENVRATNYTWSAIREK